MTDLRLRGHVLRSALLAGATPARALAHACDGDPRLRPIARAAMVGTPLPRVAATLDGIDDGTAALVRAVAVGSVAGAGQDDALVGAVTFAVARDRVDARLAALTAGARLSARVLTALPAAGAVLGAATGSAGLRGLGSPPVLCALAVAAALTALGWAWIRAVMRRTCAAADRADPLSGRPPPATGRSRSTTAGAPAGTTAETVSLLAVAARSGLTLPAALEVLATCGPPAARTALRDVQRRLGAGFPVDRAFAAAGLGTLGEVYAAAERWGGAVAPALAALAEDLRDQAEQAAEAAADAAPAALVFPTTLLLVPAFLIAVAAPALGSLLQRLSVL